MAAVTVTPEAFGAVLFDAGELAQVVADLADAARIPADAAVLVEVDERTPLNRARLVSVDPVVVHVESGAIEDPTRLRHQSTQAIVEVVGRLLVRAADRRDPSFGDPPSEADLTLQHISAWDTYALGRLSRRGFAPRRPPRRYHFRTRHGFTDAVDEAFERLWAGERLTWDDVAGLSAAAVASATAASGAPRA